MRRLLLQKGSGLGLNVPTPPSKLNAPTPPSKGFWGAEAIAQTIFGDNDNLGGKLAITVYPKDYIKEVSVCV